jgi:pantoate--beta-alanine ligase
MEIIKEDYLLRNKLKELKYKGKKIGFVPTMGALHEGHISLIKKARKDNDIVVVSIFVNPLQFGPNEDFNKYPRPIEKDLNICNQNNVDFVFLPEVDNFYNDPHLTYVYVDQLQDKLCGKSRPGHFRGVCTVVLKLFNITIPDNAYFGKKDFQQQVIINKMVKDLSLDVNIIPMPIIRDKDGIALSSRNQYLSEEERKDAILINRALFSSLKLIENGETDSSKLIEHIKSEILKGKNNKIDYISIVDDKLLDAKNKVDENTLIAVAVFTGTTRLIDNIHLMDYKHIFKKNWI